MALELVGRVVFDQLQKEIWRVKNNIVMFKSKLEELGLTLDVLSPVIEEIEELNRRLNRSDYGRETIVLMRLLEDGSKLVSKCSKIPRWDIFKRCHYREKLMELDNKILRFQNLYLQANMARDPKQSLLIVQETRQMLIMSLNQQGNSNLTIALSASSSSTDSSNLAIALTASSTDSSHKQMIVMMVHMHYQTCRSKVLRLLCVVNGNDAGVSLVGLEGDEEKG